MKVAIVHVPYQFRGGEDVHVDLLVQVYKSLSIEVDLYPKNRLIPELNTKKILSSLKLSNDFDQFESFWAESKPDFLHLHNIYPTLGPKFLKWIVDTQKKAIMTTHNHRFYCSNGLALRNGQICKDCLNGTIKWKPIVHNCNSDFKKSIYYGLAISETQSLLKHAIQHFIAPSPYIANELKKWGVDGSKVTQITNPVAVDLKQASNTDVVNDVFYAGRLSQEKGTLNLLTLSKELPNVKFVIAGDGPLKKDVIKAVTNQSNIKYFEKLSSPEVKEWILKSKLGILPSICNEILPTFVMECNVLGRKCLVPELDSTKWFGSSPWNARTMNTFDLNAMKASILDEIKHFQNSSMNNQLSKLLSSQYYSEQLKSVVDKLMNQI